MDLPVGEGVDTSASALEWRERLRHSEVFQAETCDSGVLVWLAVEKRSADNYNWLTRPAQVASG